MRDSDTQPVESPHAAATAEENNTAALDLVALKTQIRANVARRRTGANELSNAAGDPVPASQHATALPADPVTFLRRRLRALPAFISRCLEQMEKYCSAGLHPPRMDHLPGPKRWLGLLGAASLGRVWRFFTAPQRQFNAAVLGLFQHVMKWLGTLEHKHQDAMQRLWSLRWQLEVLAGEHARAQAQLAEQGLRLQRLEDAARQRPGSRDAA